MRAFASLAGVALVTTAVHAAIAAQSTEPPAATPAFEVVSIKVTTERRMTPPDAPDRYYRASTLFRDLVIDAFGYPRIRIVGLPEWDTLYEVSARAGSAMTPETRKAMLQRMLAERFGLRTHVESREMPYFALTAPRGDGQFGPRLSRTREDCAAIRADRSRRGDVGLSIPRTPGAERPVCGTFVYSLFGKDGQRSLRYMTGGTSMGAIADFLSGPAGRAVLDRTGLAGEFDFDIEFSALNGAPTDDQPSLEAAVDEQLGLKLKSERGPVDVLVIDAVRRPDEN